MDGQYQATQIWNEAVRSFYRNVPQKKHRRGLKTFDKTFTGEEAVEVLFRNLSSNPKCQLFSISRSKALALLTKFYEANYFEVVRKENSLESDVQDNGSLYRLSPNYSVESFRTPMAVKTRNGLIQNFEETGGGGRNGCPVTPVRYIKYTDTPPVTPVDRPLFKKSSHRKKKVKRNGSTNVRLRDRFSLRENNNHNPTRNANGEENNDENNKENNNETDNDANNTLISWQDFLAQSPTAILGGGKSFRKDVTRKEAAAETEEPAAKEAVARKEAAAAAHEQEEMVLYASPLSDEEKEIIWKNTTVNLLKERLHFDDLDIPNSLLPVNGKNIRWNFKRTLNGRTSPMYPTDDIALEIRRPMEYLMEYPWNTTSARGGAGGGGGMNISLEDVLREVLDRVSELQPALNEPKMAQFILSIISRAEFVDMNPELAKTGAEKSKPKSNNSTPCGGNSTTDNSPLTIYSTTSSSSFMETPLVTPAPSQASRQTADKLPISKLTLDDGFHYETEFSGAEPHTRLVAGKGFEGLLSIPESPYSIFHTSGPHSGKVIPVHCTKSGRKRDDGKSGKERRTNFSSLERELSELEERRADAQRSSSLRLTTPFARESPEEKLMKLPGIEATSPTLLMIMENARAQRLSRRRRYAPPSNRERRTKFGMPPPIVNLLEDPSTLSLPSGSHQPKSRASWAPAGFRTVLQRSLMKTRSAERMNSTVAFSKHNWHGLTKFSSEKGWEEGVETVNIALLLLPVSTRIWLQFLLKFMATASTKPYLMSQLGLNRNKVLQYFTNNIVSTEDELVISQVIKLVTFLMDNQQSLFLPSKSLYHSVKRQIDAAKTAKLCFGNLKRKKVDPLTVRYCDWVPKKELERHGKGLDAKELAMLIESIISNEKLSDNHRKKMLLSFRKEYPDAFKARFPTEADFNALFPPKYRSKLWKFL